METKDIKPLLLGLVIMYYTIEKITPIYYTILNEIDNIISHNTQYENYDLDNMKKELFTYLKNQLG